MATFANSGVESAVHVERVYRNPSLWSECVEHTSSFFRMYVLPEVVGSWFTHPLASVDLTKESIPSVNTSMASEVIQPSDIRPNKQQDTTYCYSHGPESGSMLACDNKDCPIEWFHFKCLKMKESMIPKEKWYSPNCRKKKKTRKSCKGKNKCKA